MVANGHFAGSGDGQDSSGYEHGVQVIDEEKEFKYALLYLFFNFNIPIAFAYG